MYDDAFQYFVAFQPVSLSAFTAALRTAVTYHDALRPFYRVRSAASGRRGVRLMADDQIDVLISTQGRRRRERHDLTEMMNDVDPDRVDLSDDERGIVACYLANLQCATDFAFSHALCVCVIVCVCVCVCVCVYACAWK